VAGDPEGLSGGFGGARLLLSLVARGTWLKINHALVMQAQERSCREANPTAGVIDSQSVKTTESVVA